MSPKELSDRLWEFASGTGKAVDALPDTRLGRHVANQLVRSGTAAAPNYDEDRVGESRADFIHKVNVALKELLETRGWLKFIIIPRLLPSRGVQPLLEECEQLCRILGKSVCTAKANAKALRNNTARVQLPITNSQ